MSISGCWNGMFLALIVSTLSMPAAMGQAAVGQGAARSNWAAMEVIDLSGDGLNDVVLADGLGRVVHLTNDGKGHFSPPKEICPAVSDKPGAVAIEPIDFGTDGDKDLLVFVGNGSLFRLTNDGKGRFAAPERLSEALTTTAKWVEMETYDVNSDGESDAIILAESGEAYALLSDGKGGHHPLQKIPLEGLSSKNVHDFAVSDVNGDGNRDLVLSSADGAVHSLINDGKGTFKKQ